MKVISLYTGVGGIELGLEAAGFETGVALEMDKDCCETMRQRTNWEIIEDDINDVSSDEILERSRLRKGEPALLAAGPPCQPFSKSSYWVNGDSMRMKDPRADTLRHLLRVLEDTLPQAFLFENVFGLSYKGKDEGLQYLLQELENINKRKRVNYKLEPKILNMAEFGVPQIRERIFLIGQVEGKRFSFPEPTHFDPEKGQFRLGDDKREEYKTAWDAIGDLDNDKKDEENLRVTGKWGDLLPSIPEGHNYLWHTDRMGGKPLFGWRTRYWSFLLKLAKSKPSWTIQAQPGSAIGPFHWKNRRLSVHEMCRLMTFPDKYRPVGTRVSVQRQIGNAVPPLMTEVLGREIVIQLLGRRITREKPLNLVVPNRRPIPGPENVQSVPRKYFNLIGDHAPHPGTGKGYKAKRAR